MNIVHRNLDFFDSAEGNILLLIKMLKVLIAPRLHCRVVEVVNIL